MDCQCELCGTLHQDLAMNDIGGLTVCDYCEDAALAASETELPDCPCGGDGTRGEG